MILTEETRHTRRLKCRSSIICIKDSVRISQRTGFTNPTTKLIDAFPKFRKANIVFVMSACLSVCPSVRMEQLDSHWTNFREIRYLSIFLKSCRENSTSV
jgi:hypothetical protein